MTAKQLAKRENGPCSNKDHFQQIPDPIKSKEFTMNIISPTRRRVWKQAVHFELVNHVPYIYRYIDHDVLTDGRFPKAKIPFYRAWKNVSVDQSLSGRLTHGLSDQRGVGVCDE